MPTFKNSWRALILIFLVIIITLTLYPWWSPSRFNLREKLSMRSTNESKAEILTRIAESEIIWKRSVEKRHAQVGSHKLSEIDAWDYGRFLIWWDYFYPSYPCPYEMERLGRVGDGGKWVCGFSRYEGRRGDKPARCVVYSFGVSTDSSFEAEIIERSPTCQIWAYDFSVKSIASDLGNNSRVHFKPYAIGKLTNKETNVYTLGDIMRQNGHTWIDIFKIDVEGAEFKTFWQIMNEFQSLPFGQVQIEFHANKIKNFETFYLWYEKLEERGLRAVFMEPNLSGNKLARKVLFMEYSFINVNSL